MTSRMSSRSRIMVGGPHACIVKPHSQPWAVRFTRKRNLHAVRLEPHGTVCGGTLISKNLVLTAGHCRIRPDSDAMPGVAVAAMVGEHDVENMYDQQIIGIKQEIPYPHYKGAKAYIPFT